MTPRSLLLRAAALALAAASALAGAPAASAEGDAPIAPTASATADTTARVARGPVEPFHLRVLSYNVWGIPLITPSWSHRVPRIARAVRDTGADVVGLQEVWLRGDAEAIARESGYAHWFYFDAPSRAGLLVLSRWPIEAPRLEPFGADGFPYYLLFGEADWYSGKGIATMRIRTPAGALPFADTHLIAEHSEGMPREDRFIAHRLSQVVTTAAALRRLRAEAADAEARDGAAALPLVMTGDLNALHGSLEVSLLRDLGGVESVQRAHAVGADAEASLQAQQRIDYVLASPTPGYEVTVERVATHPSGSINGPSGELIPLSDHDGVLADLAITRVPSPSEGAARPRRAIARLDSPERAADNRRACVERLALEARPGPVVRVTGLLSGVLGAWLLLALVRGGRDGASKGRRVARAVAIVLALGALAEAAAEAFHVAPKTAAAIEAARASLEAEPPPR